MRKKHNRNKKMSLKLKIRLHVVLFIYFFVKYFTFSSWAVMSSRLKLDASAGLPWCPVGALIVPAGDALVLLLLLLAPLLPPPPQTLLLLLPALPPLPPAGCCLLLLRPAGGFWRTWKRKRSVNEFGEPLMSHWRVCIVVPLIGRIMTE